MTFLAPEVDSHPARALWHYPRMEPNARLFRAIVILGAALTAPACEGGKCGPDSECSPRPDGGIVIGDATKLDAGGPSDATPMDVIVIL